jgi:uncharacterized lipoprotein YddW (UPF0748 family)
LRAGIIPLIALFAVLTASRNACAADAARSEVRAAWVTTTAHIDWPPSLHVQEQQESLRAMVRRLKIAHFNTIYFQVRGRGDAMYRSRHEPWSSELTGIAGKDPGWDPLKFLIDEAHAAGLDVHAWINVFKVRSNERELTSALHPSRKFREWVIPYEGEDWLDPGFPGVRTYTVNVILDLIRQYDLDGINLDYMRYPGTNFADARSWNMYGKKVSREAWRVNNISAFVAAVYDSCTAEKPWLKIGSSPIGIPATPEDPQSAPYLRQYSQDAPGWLKAGKQDYLSPQIYWTIDGRGNNPGFANLTAAWKSLAADRQIVAGIALYKPEVKREVDKQILCARIEGLDGAAFFRYGMIEERGSWNVRYSSPALVPPMPWKEGGVPPEGPASVRAQHNGMETSVEWTNGVSGSQPWRYAIYRIDADRSGTETIRTLLGVVPGGTTSYTDRTARKDSRAVIYEVTALTRLNVESAPTSSAPQGLPGVAGVAP